MPAVALEQVSKIYGRSVCAVDEVDLNVGDGEFVVLVGPSGCGKSTLLRMIAGLETVTSGRISIDGRDITHLSPQTRDIAMVFQNYALYPHMSVRRNLGYGLAVRRVPKREIRRRVDDIAALLGLTDLLDRKPSALSGGQKQRVAMGRALVREPAIFLMDEPLSNLDAKLRVAMRTELARLHERIGTTTIYVTHDQVEAMTLGDRVAVMRDGRIQHAGVPQSLYREPQNLFVAAFIGSPAMNLIEGAMTPSGVAFGGFEVPLTPAQRPNAETGDKVIVGIRPEDIHRSEATELGRRFPVQISVVEELGADTHVLFPVDGPRLAIDVVRESMEDDDATLLADDDRAFFNARFDGKVSLSPGDQIAVAFDPAALHFFDPHSQMSLGAPSRRTDRRGEGTAAVVAAALDSPERGLPRRVH